MATDDNALRIETVSLTVPSHPKFLYVVRSALFPIVRGAGFSGKETRKIILALDEACSNIIKYAYEGDPTKQISLTVTVTDAELRMELRDSGKKPDISKIAPRDLDDIRPGGLGTHFMNSVFETVQYTDDKEGTLLVLLKKRPHRDKALHI